MLPVHVVSQKRYNIRGARARPQLTGRRPCQIMVHIACAWRQFSVQLARAQGGARAYYFWGVARINGFYRDQTNCNSRCSCALAILLIDRMAEQ